MSYITNKEYFVLEHHRNGRTYSYFCDEQGAIELAVDVSNRFDNYKFLSVTDIDNECDLSAHFERGVELVMCVFRPPLGSMSVNVDGDLGTTYSLLSKSGLLGAVLPKEELEDEPKEYITLDGVKYKRVD